MYPVSARAYDRAITVFSPDGRLFQVEYAREAVKRGATAIGLIYRDGVMLAIDKNVTTRLIKAESIEKIFQIDEHIAVATSGLVADARRLVDFAREYAQEERFLFNQAVDVGVLTKRVCDLKQAYTQWGGTRPFGAALLVIGIDDTGKHLFETDPSGAYNEWWSIAIGSGKEVVEEMFEKEYQNDMSFDEALLLALKALTKVGDKKITPETVDVAYITEKERKYTELPKSTLAKYIEKMKRKE